MVAGERQLDGAVNTRTTTSLCGYVNYNGGKLFTLISKEHVQVGTRFQVLLEKEIHSAGNNVASKQWRRKQRVVNVHGLIYPRYRASYGSDPRPA